MKSNTENMVLILSRFQLAESRADFDLELLSLQDVWPVLTMPCAEADVVIVKEGSKFAVLKHRFMNADKVYHISSMKNIIFARR